MMALVVTRYGWVDRLQICSFVIKQRDQDAPARPTIYMRQHSRWKADRNAAHVIEVSRQWTRKTDGLAAQKGFYLLQNVHI